METSRASQLKTFETRNLGANKLGVQCPQKACGHKFIANRRAWHESPFKSASCPYCFKTAWRGA